MELKKCFPGLMLLLVLFPALGAIQGESALFTVLSNNILAVVSAIAIFLILCASSFLIKLITLLASFVVTLPDHGKLKLEKIEEFLPGVFVFIVLSLIVQCFVSFVNFVLALLFTISLPLAFLPVLVFPILLFLSCLEHPDLGK